MTPAEEAKDVAEKLAWKTLRQDPAVNLNQQNIIGSSTLPEIYDSAVNHYQHAIKNKALELMKTDLLRPEEAIKRAIGQVNPAEFSSGLPAALGYQQRLAEASRDSNIRRVMDIPENGEDEWGVLLSPVEAIREYDRRSLYRPPVGPNNPDEYIPF